MIDLFFQIIAAILVRRPARRAAAVVICVAYALGSVHPAEAATTHHRAAVHVVYRTPRMQP